LYCFQSFYICHNQKSIDGFWSAEKFGVYHNEAHMAFLVFLYSFLCIGYYIFDTANCQKASIKLAQEENRYNASKGIVTAAPVKPIDTLRNTFPKMPWAILEGEITYINTPHGNLLADGWYAFARKMQYTGDIMMALSWGLACGFGSLLPYFYVLFFTTMITHRQWRDEIRCGEKYGAYWKEYTSKVPNVFIPGASFFTWLTTGVHPTKTSSKTSKGSSSSSTSTSPVKQPSRARSNSKSKKTK